MSFGVLRAYPRLLAYPLAAAAGGLLAGALSLALAAALLGGGSHGRVVIVLAAAVAAYPVAVAWTFCGVGMAAVLAGRLDGEGARAGYGWRSAREQFASIAGWSLLACAGGAALRPLQALVPAVRRAVIARLGAPWALATLLAVPVLAYEELGPVRTLHRSAALVDRRRREQAPGTAGIGIGALAPLSPFALLVLAGIALGGGTGIALAAVGGAGILLLGAPLTLAGDVFAVFVYRSAAGLAESGDAPFPRRDLDQPFAPRRGHEGRTHTPVAVWRPARKLGRPAATAGRRRR